MTDVARDPSTGPPAPRPVAPSIVRAVIADARRLVVLDDDPTGTQTVTDIPVLTRWGRDDLRWALAQGGPGFFVLTNTRSLGPDGAAARTREVAEACLDAADEAGIDVSFASRSDSTLRGHFPLETDVLAEVLASRGRPVDGVLLVPAYVDAGRITVDGVHLVAAGDGFQPVGESEFAADATFGYRSSRLADWVAEKSGRPVPTTELPLAVVRGDPEELRRRMDGTGVLIPDVVTDDDLRAVAVAVLAAERDGRRFLYRVGPSFVRARLGQAAEPPIDDARLAALVDRGAPGLIVVGSHVGRTTRQLDRLRARRGFAGVELEVAAVVEDLERAVATTRDRLLAAESAGLVVLSTSRTRITGADASESLGIARRVSAALSAVVAEAVERRRPGFVVAKGGITSSDTATEALGIRRAWARGTLLPGIVSLWEAVEGPATGLPYIVFAGNVGDDESLADVVDRLAGPEEGGGAA